MSVAYKGNAFKIGHYYADLDFFLLSVEDILQYNARQNKADPCCCIRVKPLLRVSLSLLPPNVKQTPFAGAIYNTLCSYGAI